VTGDDGVTENTADATASAPQSGQLEELRRLAYSRPTSPGEEARAAEARRVLAETAAMASDMARDATRGTIPADTAPVATPPDTKPAATSDTTSPPATPTQPDPPSDEPDTPPPAPVASVSRRTLLIIAAAVVALGLVAGAIGGVVVQAQYSAPIVYVPSGAGDLVLAPGDAEGIVGRGDPQAAYLWFETAQAPSDVTDFAVDERIDSTSTRLVYANPTFGRVWVAKAVDLSLCILVRDPSELVGMTCAEPGEFRARGLAVSLSGVESATNVRVRWDGVQVLVALGHD